MSYPKTDDQYRSLKLEFQDALSERDDALRDGKLLDVFTDSLTAIIEHIAYRTIRFMRLSYDVHDGGL